METMLPMFKFQVEFLGEEIRRFKQVKDITEYYGIPKPSIFLCINGKIDYVNGKWAGFKIFQILEPAYELLEY
tara:strand:- start:168 stop:386 length:219 start_codon:yes stop_codon:yes gene_type:complete